MEKIEQKTGIRMFLATNTVPLKATVLKSGALSFTHATAAAIQLSDMQCAAFGFRESDGKYLLFFFRTVKEGAFEVKGRLLRCGQFTKNPPYGHQSLGEYKSWALRVTEEADTYELVPYEMRATIQAVVINAEAGKD